MRKLRKLLISVLLLAPFVAFANDFCTKRVVKLCNTFETSCKYVVVCE